MEKLEKIIGKRLGSYPSNISKDKIVRLEKFVNSKYTTAYRIYSGSSHTPKLFAKSKSKGIDDNDTFNEFNTLKYLWNAGYKDEISYRVPESYDYISENNLLVTEYINGYKLSDYLSNSLRFPFYIFRYKKVEEIIKQTAFWLVEYEKKVFGKEYVEVNEYINYYCNQKINAISGISEFEKNKIKKLINNFGVLFDKIPIHIVNTDFKPHNIIFENKVITCIDWEKIKNKGLAFWMPSCFIRALERNSLRIGVPKRFVKRISVLFRKVYIDNTIFIKYKKLFNLISSFESLTNLAESLPGDKNHNIFISQLIEKMEEELVVN